MRHQPRAAPAGRARAPTRSGPRGALLRPRPSASGRAPGRQRSDVPGHVLPAGLATSRQKGSTLGVTFHTYDTASSRSLSPLGATSGRGDVGVGRHNSVAFTLTRSGGQFEDDTDAAVDRLDQPTWRQGRASLMRAERAGRVTAGKVGLRLPRNRSLRSSPDGIRTRATALRGRRARPLHNGALARPTIRKQTTGPRKRTNSRIASRIEDHQRNRRFAGVLGLEPRLTEPESAGLPITPYPIVGLLRRVAPDAGHGEQC